ncbi:MAG: type II secretion system F family protein [Bacilli bacterium]
MRSRGRWTALAMEYLLVDLSELLQAGIDLHLALQILRARNGVHAEDLETVLRGVESGQSLSDGLAAIGFTASVVGFLQAGELAGDVALAAGQTGFHLERNREYRTRLVKMLAYPILLTFLCVVLTYVLAAVVMPNFQNMYHAMNLKLSAPTELLFSSSRLIAAVLPIALAVLALLAAVGAAARQTIRPGILALGLRWKLSRSLIQMWKAREGMEVLNLLLGAGIDLLLALRVMARADTAKMKDMWTQAAMEIEGGAPLSDALANLSLLPPVVKDMMRLAERTGDLERGSERLLHYLETYLDRSFERTLRIVEPALTFFLGGVVGLATMLLMWPMMQLVRQLS